ncbi:MAG: glycogen/starch synthase, partial [Candidatus Woesearchaeota archaeon]
MCPRVSNIYSMSSAIQVLMFGWEFPPFINGGLGTACYGLTKAMSKKNIHVTFVLPTLKEGMSVDFVRMVGLNFKVHTISSLLQAYLTSKSYDKAKLNYSGNFFGKDLYDEVHLYAEKSRAIALMEQYDIIHAHDWLTYLAGINAKELSGKPLVVHIHNTAFDRSGGNPNPLEYEIEK